jgi:hypothetical protein
MIRVDETEVAMIAAISVPVQISKEAALFIEERGIQQPLDRMLEYVPGHFPGVRSVNVVLEVFQDQTCDPLVVLEVMREDPGLEKDFSDAELDQWMIENFPPEQGQYFIHLSHYPPVCDARQSVS